MTKNPAHISQRLGPIGLIIVLMLVGTVGIWVIFFKQSHPHTQNSQRGERSEKNTLSDDKRVGSSGFPIPRFVSLKTEKVNVRRGPSSDHPVTWVFQRKGMPVEIIAESENWRRIRDNEGAEGWVLQNMLSGKRTALMVPGPSRREVPLFDSAAKSAGIVAMLAPGVVGTIEKCTGSWCAISAGGYNGYISQQMIWGVYPGEIVR